MMAVKAGQRPDSLKFNVHKDRLEQRSNKRTKPRFSENRDKKCLLEG